MVDGVQPFASWHGAEGDAEWLPGTKPAYNYDRDTFRFQVQLGSQLYPLVPISSFAEPFYQLQKCVGSLTTGVGIASGPS